MNSEETRRMKNFFLTEKHRKKMRCVCAWDEHTISCTQVYYIISAENIQKNRTSSADELVEQCCASSTQKGQN